MSEHTGVYLEGTVLDEENYCSLKELCRVCGVSAGDIRAMIEEDIITPKGERPEEWRFTLFAIHRVQTVNRLTRDLHINLSGCALVLELLDEIHALRARLPKS